MLNKDNIFQLKMCLLAHKISENEANIPEADFKPLIFTHSTPGMPQILIFMS